MRRWVATLTLLWAGSAMAQPAEKEAAEVGEPAAPASDAANASDAIAPDDADVAAPSAPPHEVEAKRLFAEGDSLRLAGDCERAVGLYLQSRVLLTSVANTLNAAICLDEVGRQDEALELYAELVSTMRAQLSEQELAAIGPEMQRLRAQLGSIDVAADVGASIVIDGRARGRLPLSGPLPIKPGAHDVRIVAEGYEPWSTVVDAKLGQTTAIRAKLEPLRASGRLAVDGPEGAELIVDGAPIGVLPFDGLLAPGEHVIQVIAGDSGSSPMRARVIEGQRTSLAPPLAPLGGRLEISVEPASANLIIDGVPMGRGRWWGRLPVGDATLEAEDEGYRALRQTLTIDISDGARPLTITLVKDDEHPRWATQGDSGALWIEALGGFAIAPSLGSGAESSCDDLACQGGAPLGYAVALRAGYELPMRLSFELAGGMLSLGRDLSRTMTRDFSAANGMDVSVAYRIDDALRFRAGFVGGGVGYRLPVAGPFELRAHALLGVLFVDASDGASGEASAGAEQAALLVSKGGDSSVGISMMAAPEVDFDLRFDDFSAGLGLTVAVVFLDGPNTALGDVYVQGSCDPASPGAACAPGQTFVRDERAHGTFVTVLPNLHLGYRF